MAIDYVAHIRREAGALADAARLGLDAPSPSCPGWSVATLVKHTGLVHQWVAHMVETGATERADFEALPRAPADNELVDWFAAGAARLAGTLEAAPDDAAVWNWSVDRPRTVGFWRRRMAHETAVHRWDVELAHGRARPVDAELAADGIDELLGTYLPADVDEKAGSGVTLGGTLHLHTTDTPGEWLVAVDDDRVELLREHGKGDAAVRGPASDVLLFLWKRVPASAVEVLGDGAVVERWAQVVDTT